jgi:ABC-type phosphate/phosphonate transport system substrate-binding protein
VTYIVRDTNDRIVHSGWLDLGTADGVALRMLATTAPIPCDAIAHRPGLASGMIERLAKTLTEVAPDDEEARDVLGKIFHTSGMMRADLRNYDPVREAMQRVTKLS